MCMWVCLNKYIRVATWPPKQNFLAPPLGMGIYQFYWLEPFIYFIFFILKKNLQKKKNLCTHFSITSSCLISFPLLQNKMKTQNNQILLSFFPNLYIYIKPKLLKLPQFSTSAKY